MQKICSSIKWLQNLAALDWRNLQASVGNEYRLYLYSFSSYSVWPDWAIFESSWQQFCLQKHWWLFGLFWKVSLNGKTAVASIWATFGNIFTPISGHTAVLFINLNIYFPKLSHSVPGNEEYFENIFLFLCLDAMHGRIK